VVLEVAGDNTMVFFNYMLNKFCPYVAISFALFSYMSFSAWQPYLIMAMVFFIDKFSFKAGYSVAYCESKGINLNDE
jgi:hypothetical protein